MKYELALEYSIAEGTLAPYFEALDKGCALAAQCASCGATSFPPRQTCSRCGKREMAWTALSGRASIVQRTDTANGAFALVRFEGSDKLATVALENPTETSAEGRLIAPCGDRPGLWLRLEGERDEHA